MKKSRKSIFLLLAIGLLIIFTACAGKTNSDSNGAGSKENNDNNRNTNREKEVDPVTIKVAIPLGEEFFEGRFGAVDEKLAHINLEHVFYGDSVGALEELFAADVYPDIIVGDYPPIKELETDYPLDDLIEKHAYDLDQIDPSLISFMRSLDSDGKIVGFPDGMTFWGLYYNKEVFDKFGKDYPDPKVPMTWTEVIELAREMTAKVGGEQYYGLTGTIGSALAEFGARSTDPETGEVLIEKDPAFKQFFDMVHSYYNIPGMETLEDNPFVETQTVAMHVEANNWLDRGWGWPEPEDVAHIDLVPIPVWQNQPTTTPAKNAWAMMIANYSEHKDEAFEVLTTYLDPEIQIGMAKTMMLQTPLVDPEVLKHYGSEIPTYEGKNVEAYFFGEAASYDGTQSNWDKYVDIDGAMNRLKEENIDVVTLLRELTEESASKIRDAMEGN